MDEAAQPTKFPELNDLLAELTERAAAILGGNFVGAYLQGSFALGDADFYSDCDFLIPVHGPLSAAQEAGLRAMHDEIPTRQGHWTHHLEGSYPFKDELKTLGALGNEWLYIDHGWREMQWSTHCNNEVARWTLRDQGVILAGPDPKTLVDDVSAQDLRARMQSTASEFLSDFSTWMSLDIAWGQRYAVTTYCRILATLDTGTVVSKRRALLWGQQNLDPTWHGLLQQTLEDRPRGFDADERARRGSAEQTRTFAAYAEGMAARWRV